MSSGGMMVGPGAGTSGAGREQDRAAHRLESTTLLTAAFAVGVVMGWYQPQPRVWVWLVIATLSVVALGVVHRRGRCAVLTCLLVTSIALGAAWVTVRVHRLSDDDLAAHLAANDDSRLVTVTGVASSPPELRARSRGSMARFDYRPLRTTFTVRIESLQSRLGEATAVRGELFVSVDGVVEPFQQGDRLEATGWLRGVAGPSNPGEFDMRVYARSLGQAGVLHVEGRELLQVMPQQRPGILHAFARWRRAVRQRAGGLLVANLPRAQSTKRDALLTALLLGERGPALDELGSSFQRVGLAHLLAISGFHLGVLAGFVLLIARLGGRFRRWHGWLVISTVVMFLFLVEVRMPVLRAGIMTIAASLGLISGSRLRIRGLVSLSALLLLVWRPDQLFTPGFQLSYAVVIGLIQLQPVVRQRLFGARDVLASTSTRMLWQWILSALAAAITAWLIAAPIVMYHFGMISPLCVPLTIAALPMVALLLAVGFAKLLLSMLFPPAAMLVGVVLSLGGNLLIALVEFFDALPGSSLRVAYPSGLWSILMLGWVVWLIVHHGRRQRRWLVGVGALLIAWFVVVDVQPLNRPTLRVDMLAVGDGSCYVVRSRGSTVLFDAGSSNDLDAGRRIVVPALHRLGVRSIDAIVISHANLDHFSAVLEVVEAFDTDRVLVTPQFLEDASQHSADPVGYLVDELNRQRIAIDAVSAGVARLWGHARWRWMHPASNDRYRRINDRSMVIAIEAAGRRVLLCGDVQRQAMATLLAEPELLQADVLELPHHGSYHELAEAFVAAVGPEYVLQSTGRRRLADDRWAVALAGIDRLITARDGACWIEIDDDGAVAFGRHTPWDFP